MRDMIVSSGGARRPGEVVIMFSRADGRGSCLPCVFAVAHLWRPAYVRGLVKFMRHKLGLDRA